ncbi:MAG: hypothetical protein GEV04_24830, partial [Actinophytocola sp.]|nr:hypothetical protein [Actinophytocola sp.]
TFAVARVIARLGSDVQKQRYLPRIIDGSIIPAFALTDLTGGSNLRAMSTFAEPHGDGTWTITGRKTHTHNCEQATLWLIFARSPNGQDALLVENPENMVLERSYQPFGFRCVPCHQVHFNKTPAHDDDLLGDPGKGVMAALTGALNYTRIGNASIVVGIASAALDVALSFAMGRRLQEGHVTDQQAVQHMIADLVTEVASHERCKRLGRGFLS